MDTVDVGVLSIFVLVVGWVVVNGQHNQREDRKESRALSDRAKAATLDIARVALRYHCEGAFELTSQIKWDLDALELELSLFPNYGTRGGPLISRYVAFVDAVTGGHFESANYQSLPRDAPEVAAILRTRNYLLTEIERQFRAYFR
jgi:hypothetical protein